MSSELRVLYISISRPSEQGRIVRSRTLECSRVKVLRVEHSRVNLFDGQLKLFESCLLFPLLKEEEDNFFHNLVVYLSESHIVANDTF